jgi:hypothetical protein
MNELEALLWARVFAAAVGAEDSHKSRSAAGWADDAVRAFRYRQSGQKQKDEETDS